MPRRLAVDPNEASPLVKLKLHSKPDAAACGRLIEDMKRSLKGANALDYFRRMELNHDARECYWENQSDDGRKWGKAPPRTGARRSSPGEEVEAYPWNGASDVRLRLIDTVIRERSDFCRLAVQRRQERLGPRNAAPEEDPQMKAMAWGQTFAYYEDETRANFRREVARWKDITEEYGCGILFTGWHRDLELVPMELSIDEIVQALVKAAMEQAAMMRGEIAQENEGTEAGGSEEQLSAEEQALITQNVEQRLMDMRADPKQLKLFAETLKALDANMPEAEAMRLARELRVNAAAMYYAVDVKDEQPEHRALTWFVDFFGPPTASDLQKHWGCMVEWVTRGELEARKASQGYDADWVASVLEAGPGLSLDLSGMGITGHSWLLSGGHVRCGLKAADPLAKADQDEFQILHLYYRPEMLEGVRGLCHTVLHGKINEGCGLHEVCPFDHGELPFRSHVTQLGAPYLLASKGAGELSFTLQNNRKDHVDALSDDADLRVKPPMQVPHMAEGKRFRWAPGHQIVSRNPNMGVVTVLNPQTDARGTANAQQLSKELFDEFWARGLLVDPEVKLAARQILVSDFMEEVLAVRKQTFKLIQQFVPDELQAAFIGGLPVDLRVTKAEIQGQLSLEMDFDAADFDSSKTKEFMESAELVGRMDPLNLIDKASWARALMAKLMPAQAKALVSNPDKRKQDEAQDEQRIAGEILTGTQFDERESYKPGDHATRLETLKRIFGVQVNDKGDIMGLTPLGDKGPTRAQKLLTEDMDVQERIANRLKFHALQLGQQQNAITGRNQVKPVTEEEAA